MLPKIETVLQDYLVALRDAREADPREGLHVRASSAGKCSRAVAFQISGLAPTNPPAVDSLVNFYIGDSVHDVVQSAIISRWPNALKEVTGQIQDWLFGHADVLYRAEDAELVVCEIKTVSDFGFELATGATLKSNGRWRKKDREAEGAKREHKLQAGIYAFMLGAKYVAIVYVRKTATKDEPIVWEWRYRLEELENDVLGEIERLKSILATVQANKMPARIFEGKEIVDPSKVKFPCGYCSHKDACISIGGGEVEIQ